MMDAVIDVLMEELMAGIMNVTMYVEMDGG